VQRLLVVAYLAGSAVPLLPGSARARPRAGAVPLPPPAARPGRPLRDGTASG